MKSPKMLIVGIVIIIASFSGFAYYQYNRPAQGVSDLPAKSVKADILFKEFNADEQKANLSYLNKALQVSGKVLEVKRTPDATSQIILDSGDPMFGVACTMDNVYDNIKAGDEVKIKGICTGYLNDVILIKSLLVH